MIMTYILGTLLDVTLSDASFHLHCDVQKYNFHLIELIMVKLANDSTRNTSTIDQSYFHVYYSSKNLNLQRHFDDYYQ